MTFVVAALMILASAAAVALPLLTPTAPHEGPGDQADEMHEREKNAALLAIREADFDQAMGKLSDEDHTSLKQIYEARALGAMNALAESGTPAVSTAAADPAAPKAGRASYCIGCGAAFDRSDKFCRRCGSGRPPLAQSE
jgi:hypothetical protein